MKERAYLTPDEVKAIEATFPDLKPRDELFVRVLKETGARIGEIIPLVPKDIDLKSRQVLLARDVVKRWDLNQIHKVRGLHYYAQDRTITVVRANTKGLTRTTFKGLPQEVYDETAEWWRNGYLLKLGLKAGHTSRAVALVDRLTLALLKEWTESLGRDEFVFKSNKGGFLSYRAAYRLVNRVLLGAGVPPEKAHPHIFRHTWAVEKLKGGLSLAHVQRQLGHTNIKTTAIYLQFVVEDVVEALEKMGGN